MCWDFIVCAIDFYDFNVSELEVINKLIMAENELKFPSANYYADGMHVTVNS